MAGIKLFGFTIGRKEVTQVAKPEQPTFTLPQQAIDDGAVTVTQGAYYGTYVDLEGSVRNELELITRYREMAIHPECEAAVEEIVNESITRDKEGKIVNLVMDDSRFDGKTLHMENSDKLTDNQMVAFVREFYSAIK